jgi:dTMP kinase
MKRTYLEAIEEVLRNAKQPLNTREIYNRIINLNLINFDAANTPRKSISSRIWEEINRNPKNSKFVRVRRGFYALRESLHSQEISIHRKTRSFFLVIEGLDGSGKTEIAHRLAQILQQTHFENVRLTFEPHDASCAGYYIRQVLDHEEKLLIPKKLLALAFAVNRADHYERVIKPFLISNDKSICICDRYYLSSLVYQTESSDTSEFDKVMDLNFYAEKPDLTIFLNASIATCYRRMKKRQEDKDLFEINLRHTREKYMKAINYLRRKYGELIVEIDANKEIDEVLSDIGTIITGEYGSSWIAFNSPLSVDTLPGVVSISNYLNLDIIDYSKQFKERWGSILLCKEEYLHTEFNTLRTLVKDHVNRLSHEDLASLFISFIRIFGYQKGDKLPWTDLDAYTIKYVLPNNIRLDGAAIILSGVEKQLTVTKKVIDTTRQLDFIFLLDYRNTQFIEYYGRDPIILGDKLLPAATSVINRDNIADMVIVLSHAQYIDEHLENTYSRKKAFTIIGDFELEDYYKVAIKHLTTPNYNHRQSITEDNT